MPVAVERQLERLAHARIRAERVLLRQVALADVDRDALVADLGDLRDLEAAVDLQRRHVGRRHALDEVELAGLEVREPHRRVDDRQVDDPVDVDLALVPVVRDSARARCGPARRARRTGTARSTPAWRRTCRRPPARPSATPSSRRGRRAARAAARTAPIRLSATVIGSTTSTLATGASSPRRFEPAIVLCRSMLNLTAAASSFSPSWNVTPGRTFIVSALLSADHS